MIAFLDCHYWSNVCTVFFQVLAWQHLLKMNCCILRYIMSAHNHSYTVSLYVNLLISHRRFVSYLSHLTTINFIPSCVIRALSQSGWGLNSLVVFWCSSEVLIETEMQINTFEKNFRGRFESMCSPALKLHIVKKKKFCFWNKEYLFKWATFFFAHGDVLTIFSFSTSACEVNKVILLLRVLFWLSESSQFKPVPNSKVIRQLRSQLSIANQSN